MTKALGNGLRIPREMQVVCCWLLLHPISYRHWSSQTNVWGTLEPHEEDLASPESVSHQMVSWKIKWQQQMEQHGKACLPTSQSQALPHATSLYPDIRVLLLVLCILLVTSCSSERSFSTLKRIKTYLRSTCGNERLTSLAVMCIHTIHRDVRLSTGNGGQVCQAAPQHFKLMNMD